MFMKINRFSRIQYSLCEIGFYRELIKLIQQHPEELANVFISKEVMTIINFDFNDTSICSARTAVYSKLMKSHTKSNKTR